MPIAHGLLRTIYLPTLLLIVQAAFLSESKQTDTHRHNHHPTTHRLPLAMVPAHLMEVYLGELLTKTLIDSLTLYYSW